MLLMIISLIRFNAFYYNVVFQLRPSYGTNINTEVTNTQVQHSYKKKNCEAVTDSTCYKNFVRF